MEEKSTANFVFASVVAIRDIKKEVKNFLKNLWVKKAWKRRFFGRKN